MHITNIWRIKTQGFIKTRTHALLRVRKFSLICCLFLCMPDLVRSGLPKQHWLKGQKISSYATALNTAFIKIRTKPLKATLLKICGENGLCHARGACQHRASLSFFWLLCKNIVPGFSKLPCIKDNAKLLLFDPEAGRFILQKDYTPLEYLETYLFSEKTPRYLEFILAKIITQLPQNIMSISTKLHSESCSKYKKMCTYPPMPPLDEET